MTPLEWMQRHVDALYVHDDRGRIVGVNQWNGGVAPRFFLGRTSAGHLWRFRSDVDAELVEALSARARAEPVLDDVSALPKHRYDYERLLALRAPIERHWSGPAYRLPRGVAPSRAPRMLGVADGGLLRDGLDAWQEDLAHRQPVLAAIVEGRAVAVCASVRISAAAHAAGVETLPAFRRRGHAVDVVAGWAQVVHASGAGALYSTSWDNLASQRVAARLGGSRFGVDFHLT